MNTASLLRVAKIVVLIGNITLIAWVLFNGLDSGWEDTPAEIASFIFLILLLALNSWLILRP